MADPSGSGLAPNQHGKIYPKGHAMELEDKGRNVVIHHLGGAKRPGRLTGYGESRREDRAGQMGAEPEEAAESGPTTDYT